MKKIYLLFILILIFGCSKKHIANTEDLSAKMPISISLKPLNNSGFEISRVKAVISKENWTNYMNLTVEDSVAFGTFENLYQGFYEIAVYVFTTDPIQNNEILIASGTGSAQITAGETTTVNITINYIPPTGNLEINVEFVDNFIRPHRILFIGNSYTGVNGGISSHILNLIENSDLENNFDIEQISPGGYTLENHWNTVSTKNNIRNGNWDFVILQEQSTRPVENPQMMYIFADSLTTLIQNSNAQSAFFMTWARKKNPAMLEDLASAYNYCGTNFNSLVVACGKAFELVRNNSSIDLYMGDGSHPNYSGTYLISCTFYSYLFHKNPIGNKYDMNGNVSAEDRLFLQKIAWSTFLNY